MKTRYLFKLLFLLTLTFTSLILHAGFDKQRPAEVGDKQWNSLKSTVHEAKLLPEPEGIGGKDSRFGYGVSVNGDRALIGSPFISGTGAAYILEYDGKDWHEIAILQLTDGQEGDGFGSSVSLSGNRAVVGSRGRNDNGINSGLVYVFEYDGMNWVLIDKLATIDSEANHFFGQSVILSGDRMLIGAIKTVYVFDYDGNNWKQTAKLIADDTSSASGFGGSISLSGDRAVMGAEWDNDNGTGSGAVYVFDFDGYSWSQTQKLTADDGTTHDNFGNSVSISGNRILVGARGDESVADVSGSAYVFDFDGMNWNQSTKITADDGGVNDSFGWSVSLSSNHALVGAHWSNENGNSATGSAYVFEYDGMNWIQSDKLVASDGGSWDRFGYSVSMSGNRVLIGAIYDDDDGVDSGSAYVFDYDGINWTQTQKFTADGGAGDEFGYSVSLFGNRALVGAWEDEDNGEDSGSVYVYDYDGMNWTQTQKLIANDGAARDWFGISVSLSGDRALVGAFKDQDNGIYSGSAYVFEFNGMNWVQSAKLIANDGGYNHKFGYSVSMSGDRMLIGAIGDDYGSGSVYVYDYNGINWNHSAKLIANDGDNVDYFGSSIDLSGNRALVGAYSDEDHGSNTGSAYVFDYDGKNWWQTQKLTADDGAAYDEFGYSVSLFGNRALVGAPGHYNGSAYVFNYIRGSWTQSHQIFAGDTGSLRFGQSVSLYDNRMLVGSVGDDNFDYSGSAYVFEYNGMNWIQRYKLSASDGSSGDWFGNSVSLYHNRVLVGSIYDDDHGTDSGSAYIFNIDDVIFSNSFE